MINCICIQTDNKYIINHLSKMIIMPIFFENNFYKHYKYFKMTIVQSFSFNRHNKNVSKY